MERHPIRVTLLANAGVLLQYRGTSLLLDGVFGKNDNPFSVLPGGCWDAMLREEPPFERLDYLLFSHYHPDHFAPGMVQELLEHRAVKGLFYPEDSAPEVRGLSDWLRRALRAAVPPDGSGGHTDRAGYLRAGVHGAPSGRGIPGRAPCVLPAAL